MVYSLWGFFGGVGGKLLCFLFWCGGGCGVFWFSVVFVEVLGCIFVF